MSGLHRRVRLERSGMIGGPIRTEALVPRFILALGFLLVLGLSSALASPSRVVAQSAVEGEYGLWIRYGDPGEDRPDVDSGPGSRERSRAGSPLTVGWLTSTARTGFLEVLVEGDVVFRRETSTTQAHEATFPAPDAEEILLRYGTGDTDPSDRGGGRPEPGRVHETRIVLDAPPVSESGLVTDVDSLFVVGDIHGEYESLIGLLRAAEIVDSTGHWIGGARHAVFLGDVFDRGPDVTRTLWFLYRLEREAAAAGGGAHVVLGNHEIMIFSHDLRYVSPKERLVARVHGVPYYELFDVRSSLLGRWLARRPSLMKIDDVLLAHGGVTPGYARFDVEALNDSIRGFMEEDLFYEWSDTTVAVVMDSALVEPAQEVYRRVLVMDSAAVARRNDVFFGEEGPFWFRGYVSRDDLNQELEDVLELHQARIHVVGHTAVPSIQSRYGGRLIAVDLSDPATEALLLVRDDRTGEYRGWRYGMEGRIGEIRAGEAP